MRRAAERAAMREELSRLWEGLLDAQQGDCLVSQAWGGTTHTHSKQQQRRCWLRVGEVGLPR